jgi:protoheme IX farnesyltransferase
MPGLDAAAISPVIVANAPAARQGAGLGRFADWLVLLKPRVVSLVVFTAIVGLVVAPGAIDPVRATAAIMCIATGAGAAGSLNMWYDRDIDALMRRTSRRPIPSGRIGPVAALAFGLVLAVASVLALWLVTNIVAAAALAGSIVFYVLVYTIWLKRRTPENIVIGGAAGALPPLIGWLAVTGSFDVLPALMFAIIFLWTPPHFWSLALWSHADYGAAGVPMLPVVAGARATRQRIFAYSILLTVSTLLPSALRLAGPIYGLAAAGLGLGFLFGAWRVLHDQQDSSGISHTRDAPARKLFRYSILYLFALFAALAVDHVFR